MYAYGERECLSNFVAGSWNPPPPEAAVMFRAHCTCSAFPLLDGEERGSCMSQASVCDQGHLWRHRPDYVSVYSVHNRSSATTSGDRSTNCTALDHMAADWVLGSMMNTVLLMLETESHLVVVHSSQIFSFVNLQFNRVVLGKEYDGE